MKVGIYSPYLNIIGGGERYILTLAEFLSKNNQIDIFWDKPQIKPDLAKYLNLKLEKVNFVPNIFLKKFFLGKTITLKKYDLLIYVTDGSLFFSPTKRNILIIQSPAHCPLITNLWEKIKFNCFGKIICYSSFVKKIIDKKLPKTSLILPPPVDVENFKVGEKKNIIISVGRFFPWLHSKKQEVLIKAFKELCQEGLSDWELYLVGKVGKGAKEYLEKIKKSQEGYPIKIIIDAPFLKLKELYSQAKIYWHATGFGEDLVNYPEKAEHFGITTVEAMASGCVPVVIKAGAQPEIVDENKNGLLWETLNELKEKTLFLINNDKERQRFSQNAIEKAKNFSKEKFWENFLKLI